MVNTTDVLFQQTNILWQENRAHRHSLLVLVYQLLRTTSAVLSTQLPGTKEYVIESIYTQVEIVRAL
jgi:hypothetical protein